MTDKKRRQRGSRTHGGGSHKKRRGAGHRGGRGRAGRDKHERLLYPPRGKHGFDRPEKAKETVVTINLREIDEDAALLAERGLAEETDGGYRVDAREIVEDADRADAVKVLAAGQVHNSLEIVADGFSDGATEQLEAAGGEAVLTELGEERAAERDGDDADDDEGDAPASEEATTPESDDE